MCGFLLLQVECGQSQVIYFETYKLNTSIVPWSIGIEGTYLRGCSVWTTCVD